MELKKVKTKRGGEVLFIFGPNFFPFMAKNVKYTKAEVQNPKILRFAQHIPHVLFFSSKT